VQALQDYTSPTQGYITTRTMQSRGVTTALRTLRPEGLRKEGAPARKGPLNVGEISGITRHITFNDAIAQSMYCQFF